MDRASPRRRSSPEQPRPTRGRRAAGATRAWTNPITIGAMSHVEHKAHAPASVRCFVVTISDTRTLDTDVSGRAIVELLEAAGHQVAGRTIVPDDADAIRGVMERQLAAPEVHVII